MKNWTDDELVDVVAKFESGSQMLEGFESLDAIASCVRSLARELIATRADYSRSEKLRNAALLLWEAPSSGISENALRDAAFEYALDR